MKISVCTDAVFRGDTPAGIRAAAAAGLPGIEFWGWTDKNLSAIAAQAKASKMSVAAMCTREFTLTDPTKRTLYLEGLKATFPAAETLSCRTLISQVGMDTGMPRPQQHDSIVEGLKAAAPLLEEAGVTLVIEPLNLRVDHAGYYLFSSDEAYDLVDEVGSPYVRVLFDIYHQQITEGDVVRHLQKGIDRIAHFHAAGNPGRHELDLGEMNYPYIFRAIEETGYSGYVGLEYMPVRPAEEGLAVVAEWVRGL